MDSYLFAKALEQSEMQTILFRIWTRAANSTSYDDNCYTKLASTYCIYMWLFIFLVVSFFVSLVCVV